MERLLGQIETEGPNAFSSSFFERHHVSIIAQQLRALELIYALTRAGRISDYSEIAIVG